MKIHCPKSIPFEKIADIVALINSVYTLTEGSIFETNYARTNIEEIEGLIQEKNLLVAQEGEEIMGVVKVGRLDKGRATFGMLSVRKSHWGKGIGRQLVQACEDFARENNCSYLQIEILRSHEIPMLHKDRLYTWYKKMGYQFQQEIPVEEMYPDIVPQMVHPGIIQVFLKELTCP